MRSAASAAATTMMMAAVSRYTSKYDMRTLKRRSRERRRLLVASRAQMLGGYDCIWLALFLQEVPYHRNIMADRPVKVEAIQASSSHTRRRSAIATKPDRR